jgi:DNA-binding PadR family transcriptional regulator
MGTGRGWLLSAPESAWPPFLVSLSVSVLVSSCLANDWSRIFVSEYTMTNTLRLPSNPLALAILAQLLERPMHPYEIAGQIRDRGLDMVFKLNYGSLYTVVESLERAGHVAPRETSREGRRPERTVYELTQSGRQTLFAWLRDVLRRPVNEYPRFAGGLAFIAALPPDEAALLLIDRMQALEHEVVDLRATLDRVVTSGLPRLFVVEGEYSLAMREAELEWVRHLHREIVNGSLDGIATWITFHAESPEAAMSQVRERLNVAAAGHQSSGRKSAS